MLLRIFSVATGRYLNFWADFARSADSYFRVPGVTELVVFTDEPEIARSSARYLTRVRTRIVRCPSLDWPDASLLRYHLISDSGLAQEADVAVFADADMRIVSLVGPELRPNDWVNGIALVEHPGFGMRLSQIRGGGNRMRVIASRATTRLRELGRLGTWERSTESSAYVPWNQRKTYVCGGFWMGHGGAFQQALLNLRMKIDVDVRNDRMARWHDESHLNRFAATHEVSYLGSQYCWDERLPSTSQPYVVAVDKLRGFGRD